MSRSDRRKGTADRLGALVAVILAAAIFGLGVILFGYLEQVDSQREADKHTQEYAANTYGPANYACLIPPAQGQRDCLAKAANEYREYQRNESDLVAQKASAIWAFIMGASAVFGAVLSAVGVYLVWTTFRATKEGNLIAREIGHAQSRAYLTCSGGKYSIAENWALIDLQIKNNGQSPALSADINAEFVWHLENSGEQVCRKPIPSGSDIIPMGGARQIRLSMDRSDVGEQKDGWIPELGDGRFYAKGQLVWDDVFGTHHFINVFVTLEAGTIVTHQSGTRYRTGNIYALNNTEKGKSAT